jgi:hypothetical protein
MNMRKLQYKSCSTLQTLQPGMFLEICWVCKIVLGSNQVTCWIYLKFGILNFGRADASVPLSSACQRLSLPPPPNPPVSLLLHEYISVYLKQGLGPLSQWLAVELAGQPVTPSVNRDGRLDHARWRSDRRCLSCAWTHADHLGSLLREGPCREVLT